MARLKVVVRPELVPSKDLQNSLTLPVHQIALDGLIRDADEPTCHRFYSLATPHSTAWQSSLHKSDKNTKIYKTKKFQH